LFGLEAAVGAVNGFAAVLEGGDKLGGAMLDDLCAAFEGGGGEADLAGDDRGGLTGLFR
jgi:hypothetical protein